MPDQRDNATEDLAFLRDRIRLLSKVLCILGAAFLVLPFFVLWMLAGLDSAVVNVITPLRIPHVVLVLWTGAVWLVAGRVRMPRPALQALDAGVVLVAVACVLVLVVSMSTGNSGALTLALAFGHFVVLRAVIVPSSGKRTFWLGLSTAAATVLAFTLVGVVAPRNSGLDAPVDPVHANVNLALWLLFAVASSTIASRVIYGLREEVRKARTIGQYVIRRRLGEGGMGVVYQATHAMLRRETAIKLVAPSKVDATTLQRFEREVRQTARLTHPNTVSIFDYGRTPDGIFYYAMEFLEGVDLQRLVEAEGPLPPARVVHILSQVLSSLAEAHDAGLIHRDIKPANIMLTQRGGEYDVAKVLDFGLVKEVDSAEDGSLTATRSLTGTPMYLPPEAIEAPDSVGPASDLYAVSAVGYFLLTGTEVFGGATVIEVCAHHLHSEPEPPSERLGRPLPEDLAALILQGLAKNPNDRPPGARQLRHALQACDVPAWTEEQARAWWTSHQDVTHRNQDPTGPSAPDTVLIDLDRRSENR